METKSETNLETTIIPEVKTQKYAKYSLHVIENINNINDLAKHYDLMINHTKYVLKYLDANDLVHDLFIKLDIYFKKYPDKVINGGFILFSLKNLINNVYSGQNTHKKHFNTEIHEFNSSFRAIEDKNDSDDSINIKLINEANYDIIEEMLSELTWEERTVLEYSLTMSVSEMSRLSGVPYQNLNWQVQKAKRKLGISKRSKNNE